MAKQWRITAYNGEAKFQDWVLRGRVSHKRVEQLLARLQARHLTDSEIIDASKGDVDGLMPVKTLQGPDYATNGKPCYYTADWEDA